MGFYSLVFLSVLSTFLVQYLKLFTCMQKEMKNSLLTDYAIESKTKDVKTNVGLTEIKTALKKQIYRDIYRAQVMFITLKLFL